MKKIIYSGLVTFGLILTGCGGGSDAASCRFNVQQNLDTGNFNAVITELSNPSSACIAAYNTGELQIDLGAAYMGESGFGVSDIISLIGVKNGAESTYETFIKNVSVKQSNSALTSLEKAINTYTLGLENSGSTQSSASLTGLNKAAGSGATTCQDLSLTTSQKDICLYIGLANTMLATTSINCLVENIASLFNDNNLTAQNIAKEDMQASMCALEFAYRNTTCAQASSITGSEVVFTHDNNSTRTFRDIAVTINGTSYHRLATLAAENPGSTFVTKGYCSNDFSNPSEQWSPSLYPCPLNKDPNQKDLKVTTLVIDTLNNGLNAVSGALGKDPKLQNDINAYKAEIDKFGVVDGVISLDEIQAYLLTL